MPMNKRPRRARRTKRKPTPGDATIDVCTGTREVRELAVIAAAHVDLAWRMLNGDHPPDGEALFYAIRDARAAGIKARDLARALDDASGRRGRAVN